MPAALIITLHRELLREGVAELVLVDAYEVNVGVVIVHQQVVLEQLVAGVRMEVEAVALILDGQTSVQHVALILALAVLVGVADYIAVLGVEHAVGIGLLAHILIVGHPVERQALSRLIHQAQATAGLVHVIGTLARERVFPETIGAVIEGSHRECQLVAHLITMGGLDITVEARADAQTDIGTLIAHGVLGVLAHQSALGINTVERTLRTAQHVDTVELIGIAVEGRLVHQGDIVDIDAHRGAVHTRADAAHIDGRRESRTIVGHDERGHIVGELAQVAQSETAHLIAGEHGRTHGLLAQLQILLRL